MRSFKSNTKAERPAHADRFALIEGQTVFLSKDFSCLAFFYDIFIIRCQCIFQGEMK